MELSPDDRAVIESLEFDPSLEPSFDIIKSCLAWPDEVPKGISGKGNMLVGRLLIWRSFLHREMPEEAWGLDPSPYRLAWQSAVSEKLSWPGFRRLTLSSKDKQFLEKCLAETAKGGGY